MRWMLLGLVIVTGVSPGLAAQDESERTSIQVRIPLSKRVAFDRSMRAFLQENLVVADGNADVGMITSAPVTTKTGLFGSVQYTITIRASVLADGDSAATVVLSGTYVHT